jgi:hypothetical protein
MCTTHTHTHTHTHTSRFMRTECLSSRWAFDEPLPVSRLVDAVGDSESFPCTCVLPWARLTPALSPPHHQSSSAAHSSGAAAPLALVSLLRATM